MSMERRTFIKLGAAAAAPLIIPARAWSALGEPSEVVTTNGPVRGRRVDGVHVFKGLRYGQDTARTRFAKPLAPEPWSEVATAYEYGAACPQGSNEPNQSEDCLFLNVWTPGLGDGGQRPVMFYIHGGAYSNGSGSSPLYDGARLAAKYDAVVVTVNHRLNAFGYLYLDRLAEGFPDSGNAGQWDLILALEWVKANATAFGGDPARVLAFGQSGGGAKIATMMASPAAKGLFSAAATMSGQQVTACGPLNGTERAKAFLNAVGLSPEQAGEVRELPWESLVEGLSARDPINPVHGLYFGPVLDGHMLTRHPFWPDAPGQSSAIPMILGNTIDETKAFLGGREGVWELSWEDVPGWLERELRCDIHPDEVVRVYRELYPDYTPSEVMFAATTAGRSWRGQVEEADVRAREEGPTWVCRFDRPSPLRDGKFGAGHTIDIPFAFLNLDAEGSMAGTTATDWAISERLSESFFRLVAGGDPNHAGLPEWSRHTLPERQTMIFDAVTRQENDPRGAERELFARVPFIQWGS